MSFTIIGTGSALPKKVVTNDELAKLVDTTDEWIYKRTGIKNRHVCTDENISSLATDAGKKAVKNAGILPEDIDLIICSTIRGDFFTPSLGCVVQKNIGAKCPAFDINAACSGFAYALEVAAGFFERKTVNNVLVISAETMTKMADFTDRSTCVLFGDGAGAVVLTKGEDLLASIITAKGDDEVLVMPNIEGNSPYNNSNNTANFLQMKGQEVFKFAVTSMHNNLKNVIAKAGLTTNDVDWVFPHQANIRIIKTAQSRLDIPSEKYALNIENTGNISSACIPILIDQFNNKGKLKKGNIIALTAFGGGLTTGSAVIRWNK